MMSLMIRDDAFDYGKIAGGDNDDSGRGALN